MHNGGNFYLCVIYNNVNRKSFDDVINQLFNVQDIDKNSIFDLVKDATKFDDYFGDGDGFEYEDKLSKAEKKKLDEYEKIQDNAQKKIEEILRGLVK